MSDRRTQTISESASVQLYDVDCRAPRSKCGLEEHVLRTQLIIPRRGVFGVTRQGEKAIAEPTTAIILRAGSSYAVDHPSGHGDRCAVFMFEESALANAFGDRAPEHGRIAERTQFASQLTAGMSAISIDEIDRDEAAFLVLRMVAEDLLAKREEARSGPLQQKRINEVLALLGSCPQAAWTLKDVARAVHVSPYHLAHQFRAITGTTIGRYILRLRLALVLDRIAEGDESLSQLAVETGFAHHSHLTERFRCVFGMTPSVARRRLSGRELQSMRATLDSFIPRHSAVTRRKKTTE